MINTFFSLSGMYGPMTRWMILVCITEGQGKQRQIEMSIYKKNRDSVYLDIPTSYISGFNKLNKSMHLFNWLKHEDHYDLIEHMQSPHVSNLFCGLETERKHFRRSSVSRYPDIEMTDKEFQNKQVI